MKKNSILVSVATVFALVAAIAFGVVSCWGHYFSNFGAVEQLESIKAAAIVAVLLFVFSYGAKLLKSTGRNFRVCRVLEYLFLICFVGVLFYGFRMFSCFVNVVSDKKDVQETLNASIDNSFRMFDDYNAYVDRRTDESIKYMDAVDQAKRTNVSEFKQVFGDMDIEKQFLIEDQKLSLASNLKDDLLRSIDQGSVDAIKTLLNEYKEIVNSSWCTFRIVDISKSLQNEIDAWNKVRVDNSSKKYKYENLTGDFIFNKTVNSNISLKEEFTEKAGFSLLSVLFILITGLLMLLPYLLSRRHTRAEGLGFSGGYKPKEYEVIL